ncbi:MAG: ABC transporter permease [Chlorobiaceae bacterium]|jgi:cell division transport system permease protein|nr:ABC transporter permease [Chlorobiaceae bacterium]NTW63616.1 ABC transporter permease [Chlorobiaceae bacterium]
MSLLFVVKEGFSGIRRSRLPAAITVTISFFALVLLGLFSTVSLSFFDLIQELRSRMEIEVFFSDTINETETVRIVDEIKKIKGVKESVFVSKKEAAAIFAHDFGEDVEKILGSNPLPRSLKLKFYPEYACPDSLLRVVPKISKLDAGLDIRYNQTFLGQIEQNARIFTLLTGGLGILIAIATLVLIGYTIRLAMYSHQEKIRTMRLVGATGWLIGAPYVIEGALQGIISGLLAAGAVYLVFEQLLLRYEPGVYQVLHPSATMIYPALVLLGLLLGVIGSTLSVSKYLRLVSRR